MQIDNKRSSLFTTEIFSGVVVIESYVVIQPDSPYMTIPLRDNTRQHAATIMLRQGLVTHPVLPRHLSIFINLNETRKVLRLNSAADRVRRAKQQLPATTSYFQASEPILITGNNQATRVKSRINYRKLFSIHWHARLQSFFKTRKRR